MKWEGDSDLDEKLQSPVAAMDNWLRAKFGHGLVEYHADGTTSFWQDHADKEIKKNSKVVTDLFQPPAAYKETFASNKCANLVSDEKIAANIRDSFENFLEGTDDDGDDASSEKSFGRSPGTLSLLIKTIAYYAGLPSPVQDRLVWHSSK